MQDVYYKFILIDSIGKKNLPIKTHLNITRIANIHSSLQFFLECTVQTNLVVFIRFTTHWTRFALSRTIEQAKFAKTFFNLFEKFFF